VTAQQLISNEETEIGFFILNFQSKLEISGQSRLTNIRAKNMGLLISEHESSVTLLKDTYIGDIETHNKESGRTIGAFNGKYLKLDGVRFVRNK
jgi:hypothetical protein